jgi:hypothetical protein
MTPITGQTKGPYPLTGVGALPNVTVAFPGEHWSNRYASGDLTPGVAVVPAASGGKLFMRQANSSDAATQLAIALRPVDVPDTNTGPSALGPNEIRNQAIEDGTYVHAYYSGAFHLTLVVPGEYNPGELIGWDADGARPEGKAAGTGAWAKNSAADIDSIFEVMEWRKVNAKNEGILTVRSLRGQF